MCLIFINAKAMLYSIRRKETSYVTSAQWNTNMTQLNAIHIILAPLRLKAKYA